MCCMVDGTIPASSGLSSSSALVCCAALVSTEANQKSLSKVTLAETCSQCERYIGTEGLGMDQSISFLAEEGTMLAVARGLDWSGLLKLQKELQRLIVNCTSVPCTCTARLRVSCSLRLCVTLPLPAPSLSWAI
ncbi:N-acetylgalactosamine kinase-like [Carassius gibelio]|uniref:N-acetylgalactosamine kinase-like n=1 Tax=Carassius gibelio TaxID=101364 RepID=UPI002279ADC1|nr:N-acetylgalactosamine kinase-like [Carassius gibelio]